MRWQDYIEQRPDVMVGKPVFKGTRLTVETILEDLGNGRPEADLLDAHPKLRPEHLRAAMAFAAASIGSEETIFAAETA
ncbi:MAG: DUF433 domain-containing protein [Candidatus Sumerlaeaceae bacterium]|nr:DUF433 domain-containing protein [Candidatus Sumerlaeaceae bacterium]